MLFNSISYFIFFPIVFTLYWVSPKAWKKSFLLLASYFFYMSWIPKYGLMIAVLTLCNYLFGLALGQASAKVSATKSRLTLALGLALNLGVLIYFKYIDFFLKSAVDLFNLSVQASHLHFASITAPAFDVILPLGISFFVFEFIHYLVDVYKGEKAVKDPIDFALFAAFFPSQIAGPIKRFENFLPQLNDVSFRSPDMQAGLTLILQGLFKKVAVADNLAIVANTGFNPILNLTMCDAWIAALAFTLQIYFDFSGYTDIGRGSALLLGISLPDNFNFPYLASSISDFWRRWHISLSTWLRDYLYIPLGGGRNKKSRNLMLTMILGGLWHGAALHFVVWGAYHGALLVLNNWYDALAKKSSFLNEFHSQPVGKVLSVLVTFALVVGGWILFRADTIPVAMTIFKTLLVGPSPEVTAITKPVLLPIITRSPALVALVIYSCYAAIFSLPKFSQTGSPTLRPLTLGGWLVRIPLYAAVALCAIGFAPLQPSSFIYFQF